MPLPRPAPAALFTLAAAEPEFPFPLDRLSQRDNFIHGLRHWRAEREKPGTLQAASGLLVLDVRAGATVWFLPELREVPGQ
ncbi:MAG: hypothetical protein ABI759_03865 [Candidatus Solibacter sp.]